MKQPAWLIGATLLAAAGVVGAEEMKVKVTPDLESVTVMHEGEEVVIKRDQDPDGRIAEDYTQTSRECPPFCVQPMQLLPGVHTIGEIELLEMLADRAMGEDEFLLIDSRTPDWFTKGTIPSAQNIPWTQLHPESSTFDPFVAETLLIDEFDVKKTGGLFDFREAKKLVLFCNGPWCGQSPTNIRALVGMGYPADKIYWYRGGMQLWHTLGLTTVKP
ncbi:rhodanese-like domain-containing protein [Guyparkeria hydrothermalis]|uniref:Rhodanese-like domain-containing protein n=1 Tax=Guyparkeria halophila TaxID=47960 RepID=A0A6I6D4Z0_9GAMM|nr:MULTISPECIES: rhodanese-like domain-containing protein [Guyparkeria]MCL7749996.1 rhodanese-like domain-containing protein [Guyparkeria hydrothermalis]QGT78604.1 rhodanese-like domain-containing protein [Guyparkeria halophila]